jgi:hypothetical protein
MISKPIIFLLSLGLLLLMEEPPAQAQPYQFDYTSSIPFQETSSGDFLESKTIQSIYRNPVSTYNAGERNGLPPTSTDSFVYEAGGMAELIYGDEGTGAIPPFFDFEADHRIEAGTSGRRAEGLSTGHSSPLPSTFGGDEFYMPEAWRMLDSTTGLSVPVTPEQP